jgi:hypothetical protein
MKYSGMTSYFRIAGDESGENGESPKSSHFFLDSCRFQHWSYPGTTQYLFLWFYTPFV